MPPDHSPTQHHTSPTSRASATIGPGRRRFRGAPEQPATERSLVRDEGELLGVRQRDRVFRLAVLSADLVAALLVAALTTTWWRTAALGWFALLLPVVVVLVNSANGLYERDARVLNKNTLDEAPTVFRAATMVTIVSYLIASSMLAEPLGAVVVGFVWTTVTLSVLACRMLARALARGALPPERCLVLGDHEHGRRVAEKLGNAVGLKSQLVGVMPLTAGAGGFSGASFRSLADTVRRKDVHRIMIVPDAGRPQQELEAIQAAKALGVKVSVLPRVLEVVGSSASYDYLDGLTVLGVPRFGMSPVAELAKRCFDVAGSAFVLLLMTPVITGIALAIRFTSPGGIFFRQARIGRNGRSFSMLKFRSMQDGADSLKHELRDRNEQEDGLFKIADDPRMTRVGKLLRRTSLDELPQLINVVRGEMSLVGPRPLVPEEDRQIQGWHRRRLHLTPGMTGPWQVLGSSRIPLREMVTIDYLYVANWSLWNDVKIMLRTIGTVLGRRGR